jgi:hypothetical protein
MKNTVPSTTSLDISETFNIPGIFFLFSHLNVIDFLTKRTLCQEWFPLQFDKPRTFAQRAKRRAILHTELEGILSAVYAALEPA